MLVPADSYEGLRRAFSWRIPARYNMGVACADAHADGSGRPALIFVEEGGAVRT